MIRILKKIFFLPVVPTVLFMLFGYMSVIVTMAFPIHIPAVSCLSYVLSAYALILTVTGFPHFMRGKEKVGQYLYEHPFTKRLRKTGPGGRFFGDVRFRTEISLYQGLFINILYIAIKMISGILCRSPWFIALAVYYMLLAAMRLLLLHRGKKKTGRTPMEEELHRCRLCGIVLFIMNEALAGIVIFMVYHNRGFDYPGVLLYAMALYSFYSVILAFVSLVRFRKYGSPVLLAAKVINLVAAMVSILSLETAMLAQFGGDDEAFRVAMTGATGGSICLIVIGMAVYMIGKSTKQMKVLEQNLL